MNAVWKIALGAILAVASAFAGGAWFMGGFTVPSDAMEPAIAAGSLVLVSRVAYSTGDPRRLDVVVMRLPDQEGQVVRRIVGLPGETVEVRNDALYVNGEKVNEPSREGIPEESPASRPASASPANYGPVALPTGTYFVLGDNRLGAQDSRQFGFVPRGHVLGRVVTVAGKVLAL